LRIFSRSSSLVSEGRGVPKGGKNKMAHLDKGLTKKKRNQKNHGDISKIGRQVVNRKEPPNNKNKTTGK